MRALFTFTILIAAAAAASADGLRLGLPIACEPGKTCWVQQYPDHDPASGAEDYACGQQTYDGHDGTDIRVRDTRATADVLASAAGTVKAVRGGMADRLVKDDAGRAALGNRDCGNGIVIDHGGGWQTQYCHLRQGSVAVRAGDRVEAGRRLGAVGYSGMAEFPHVHLTVRKDGKAVDPFRPAAEMAGRCGGVSDPLWTEDALAALTYHRGDIIGFGFAPGAVDLAALENGSLGGGAPGRDWPAVVAYVWAINLLDGDVLEISLEGPHGLAARNSARLDRSKAQYMLFTGVKRPAAGWPAGTYRASVRIGEGTTARLSQHWEFLLP